MKALSIKQPWAGLILAGIKEVENRTWRTSYRGELVIHAGKSVDRPALAWPPVQQAHWSCMGLDEPLGQLLGIVEVYDCVPAEACQLDWAGGPWCWLLRTPHIFLTPQPYQGQLRLFDVPGVLVMSGELASPQDYSWILQKRGIEHAMETELERTGRCPD